MEMAFSLIREWASAGRPRGRPKKILSEQNRVDIVVLDADGYPTFLIEVKRTWDNGPCFKDLARIRGLLPAYGMKKDDEKKQGSLRAGFLVFMLAAPETIEMSAQKSVQMRISEVKKIVLKYDHNL